MELDSEIEECAKTQTLKIAIEREISALSIPLRGDPDTAPGAALQTGILLRTENSV
jgi:hypothetical protein